MVACGPSSTAPDPRVPPTTGTPDRLTVIDWQFGRTSTTARAVATWGWLYTAMRDVTSEAEWTSSAPQIVTVTRRGELVSGVPGDADLLVQFRGVTVTRHVRVYSGEAPLLILEPSHTTYVSSDVRDVNGRGVGGATVQIVGGHNAGRTAVTDDRGSYEFLPPFVCGLVSARAMKTGYRAATGSSMMCMDGMPTLILHPES